MEFDVRSELEAAVAVVVAVAVAAAAAMISAETVVRVVTAALSERWQKLVVFWPVLAFSIVHTDS